MDLMGLPTARRRGTLERTGSKEAPREQVGAVLVAAAFCAGQWRSSWANWSWAMSPRVS